MNCALCKQPVKYVFVLREDIQGKAEAERKICFLCISDLGDKIMTEHRRAQIKADEDLHNGRSSQAL